MTEVKTKELDYDTVTYDDVMIYRLKSIPKARDFYNPTEILWGVKSEKDMQWYAGVHREPNMIHEETSAVPSGRHYNLLKGSAKKAALKRYYKPKSRYVDKREERPKGSVYDIHDNGAIPFVVVYDGDTVRVMAPDSDLMMTDKHYEEPAYTYMPKELWRFKSPKRVMTGENSGYESPEGNSVLVHTKGNTYVHIGNHGIFSFSSKDKIEHFYSRVMNSDAPFAVAISKSTYFSLFDTSKLPIESMRASEGDWSDSVREYYDRKGPRAEYLDDFLQIAPRGI